MFVEGRPEDVLERYDRRRLGPPSSNVEEARDERRDQQHPHGHLEELLRAALEFLGHALALGHALLCPLAGCELLLLWGRLLRRRLRGRFRSWGLLLGRLHLNSIARGLEERLLIGWLRRREGPLGLREGPLRRRRRLRGRGRTGRRRVALREGPRERGCHGPVARLERDAVRRLVGQLPRAEGALLLCGGAAGRRLVVRINFREATREAGLAEGSLLLLLQRHALELVGELLLDLVGRGELHAARPPLCCCAYAVSRARARHGREV
mmetsp:Transcript_4462/g.12686  ORF Transcript_4462/g.12686 Transcript_4462/m.12686 type:complete len:267 (-) Transcript_4462:72-872(-)